MLGDGDMGSDELRADDPVRRVAPPARLVVATVLLAVTAAVVVGAASGALSPGGAEVDRGAVRADVPPRQLRVIAGGDILTESPVRAAAAALGREQGARFDFAPLLAADGLAGWADLAICHLELPVGVPGGPYGWAGRSPYGGNLLLSPYELAPALAAASFDRCSTASNHSFDLGVPGIASTLNALDANGITHAGTARTEAESRPTVFDVGGVAVAHLSYTRYSNTVRPAQAWMLAHVGSASSIIADVESVRAAGAEVVIVSIHVSREMQRAPSPDDRAFAEAVVAGSEVDLVVHHGPHVVQPMEMIGDVPVFWSVGNFVSGMGVAGTGRYEDRRTLDGLLAAVRFDEQPDGSFVAAARAVTVCTDPVTRRVRHGATAAVDPLLSPAERQRAAECVARTRSVVPDAG